MRVSRTALFVPATEVDGEQWHTHEMASMESSSPKSLWYRPLQMNRRTMKRKDTAVMTDKAMTILGAFVSVGAFLAIVKMRTVKRMKSGVAQSSQAHGLRHVGGG